MRNKPAYAIESVDHALHLAQLLQQEGPLRVTDAAGRLGVSVSTAHRLLAMLVYRDFAEQTQTAATPPAVRSVPPSRPRLRWRCSGRPRRRTCGRSSRGRGSQPT